MAKANRALSLAGQLNAARERKFVVSQIVQSGDNLGHLIVLNNPDQGLSDQQRVGDRIRVTKISLRGWSVIPGSATGRFALRFLILVDKQNTLTGVDQVFVGTGSNICPLNAFVKDFRKQFTVLYDSETIHMDQYNKGVCKSWFSRCNLVTQFVSGTTTIATGSLKLVVLTNQSQASNQKPIWIGSVRVDYTDS